MTNDKSSLTEGLGDLSNVGGKEVASNRIDLGGPSTPRQAIDANWSKGKKIGVGVTVGVLALAGLGFGGFMAWENRPVSLPNSVDEAVTVMASSRYDNLDEERQRQYALHAASLLEAMSEEERRAVFEGWRESEEIREAMGEVWRQRSNEFMRQLARNEANIEQFMQGFRQGGRGFRGGGDGNRPEPTDEQRQQRAEEIGQRMADAFNSGNGQENALRQEMGKAMRSLGMGRGGFRGGGGRGPGGGGGG
ncbi:MAG: hypothetical protein AAFR38_11155 [Planctomycetota bacterium]